MCFQSLIPKAAGIPATSASYHEAAAAGGSFGSAGAAPQHSISDCKAALGNTGLLLKDMVAPLRSSTAAFCLFSCL